MGSCQPGVDLDSSDFKKIYYSNFLNIFGSSFSAGAVAVLVIQKFNFPDSQVPFILGISAVIAALISIPILPLFKYRKKRSLLKNLSLLRGFFLSIFALLVWDGFANFFFIMFSLVLSAFLGIAFGSVMGAHARDLIRKEDWHVANGKIDALVWIMPLIAAPAGGLATSFVDPGFSLLINGFSYILAGLLIRSIKYPEPYISPGVSVEKGRGIYDVFEGWRVIFNNCSLKYFFLNAMVFGGCLSALNPLVSLFVLKEISLGPEMLSLILAIPAIAGFVGAKLSKMISLRIGSKRVLLWGCAARSIWAPFLFLSPDGFYGFLYILFFECVLMFFAGLFNPLFASYRMQVVNRENLLSVSAAWPISASFTQPLFLLLSSWLLGLVGIRTTLFIVGLMMLVCIALVPWRKVGGINL